MLDVSRKFLDQFWFHRELNKHHEFKDKAEAYRQKHVVPARMRWEEAGCPDIDELREEGVDV